MGIFFFRKRGGKFWALERLNFKGYFGKEGGFPFRNYSFNLGILKERANLVLELVVGFFEGRKKL